MPGFSVDLVPKMREFTIQEPVPRSMAEESTDHYPTPLTTGPSAER